MFRLILALVPAAMACAQILTWDEYRAMASPSLGLLRLGSDAGQLIYFGARHTQDPADPQIEEIARRWREFRPTLALTEGGVPPAAGSVSEAAGRYGEAGLVRFLASRDGVAVRSLDAALDDQIAALLRVFPADRVKLFFFLRAVADFRKGPRRESLAGFAQEELARLSRHAGLGGAPKSPRQVASVVPDWADVTGSWFDPLRSGGFTNEVTRELSRWRDLHMVEVLVAEVGHGQRVFAIAGRTHVVMQERALRSALR